MLQDPLEVNDMFSVNKLLAKIKHVYFWKMEKPVGQGLAFASRGQNYNYLPSESIFLY